MILRRGASRFTGPCGDSGIPEEKTLLGAGRIAIRRNRSALCYAREISEMQKIVGDFIYTHAGDNAAHAPVGGDDNASGSRDVIREECV